MIVITAKQDNTRALMWTILVIALVQMPHIAITPAIDTIANKVFPEVAYQTIQTVMALPNILSVAAGVLAAVVLRYGFTTKKVIVVTGLVVTGLTGAVAFLLHMEFWQLCLMNVMIGLGMGMFIPTAQSIMFDSFDEKTRQFISGVQFSCCNGGGIIISVLGGLLTTRIWYGGHIILLVTLPVALLAFFVIRGGGKEKRRDEAGGQKAKLPPDVYYFTFLIFVYMIMYNVGAYNLSTHLAAGSIGDSAAAGVATALMMAGGVASGLIFSKVSPKLRDNLFTASFIMMFIGYSLLNLFPESYTMTLLAMFINGASLSLFIPRCIFRVSNLTDPTNSATATMLIASVAPGVGSFLSPVIITNLTLALGGESTRFRYQFSAFICLALAALVFLNNLRRGKREAQTAL